MVDTKKTVALSLAEGICPGCKCCSYKAPAETFFPENFFADKAPCPFFHPDNFYYHNATRRFECHNWQPDGAAKPDEKDPAK